MGIYIPGMKMPKDEKAIHLEIHSDGIVLMWQMGDDDKVVGTAIELPSHGRLIDADAFLARNAYFADRDFINSKYDDTLKDLVDAAPTIIPADPADDSPICTTASPASLGIYREEDLPLDEELWPDLCLTCRWGPPSVCDGKPCCACEPDIPGFSCYERKEDTP